MILPSNLPPPKQLKSIMQSLAALDAIFSPEWDYRYYSFDSNWSPTSQMGSIRNGSGDDVFVLFKQSGCFLKGFSHEFPQPRYTPEMFYQNVPDLFKDGVSEPAFSPDNISFCVWHAFDENGWQTSIKEKDLDSGVFFLLKGLDGSVATYQKFVEEYYEIEADIHPLEKIYKHTQITKELALTLNGDVDLLSLSTELNEIGFPHNIRDEEKPKSLLGKLFGRK